MSERKQTRTGSREPWPWLIALSLSAMIAISLSFFAIALIHPDPDVRDVVEGDLPIARGEAPQ